MKEREKHFGELSVPELLVPAGGKEQLRAAVAGGADAVYLSGTSFNARINADNFGDGDLQEAIDTAHEHGVRVHVALNTLLRNCEVEEAVSFARRCRQWGADALILQDRGLSARLREEVPDIDLHLSTQGTVYDSAGVSEAVEAGFQRVILSRELSLENISEICRQTDAEIEIFVHGAVCISYSGQCHLSYAIGGRSGNRGTCAQPCRLPYALMCRKENSCREIPQAAGKYLLSPADMCLLRHLREITEAGVTSLKIEGRMKSPEYVAVVTGIYRRHLDLLRAGKSSSVTKQEYEDLCTVFNRGGMTDAYFRGDSGSALMSCDLPKHRGIPAGRVLSCDPGKRRIVVKLSRPLSVGDGIEIRSGGKRFGNVVTYLNDRGNVLRTARADDTVTIGDIEGNIRSGSEVFKISDRQLKKRAEQMYQKIPGSIPADITVSAEEGKRVLLRACAPLWRGRNRSSEICAVEVKSDAPAERGQKKVLKESDVIKQVEKTGGTPYFLNRCDVSVTGVPMVPSSVLNTLRRQALEELTEMRLQQMRQARPPRGDGEFRAPPEQTVPRLPHGKRKTEAADAGRRGAESRICLYFFDTDSNEKKASEVLRILREKMRRKNAQRKSGPQEPGRGTAAGTKSAADPGIDVMIPYRRFLKNPSFFTEAAGDISGRTGCGTGADAGNEESGSGESADQRRVRVVPYLPAVTRGFDIRKLEHDAARLEKLGSSGTIDAVLIAHAGQKSLFSSGALLRFSDENFNISNKASVSGAFRSGIDRVMLSNELPDEDIAEILSDCGAGDSAGTEGVEIAVYGRIPVMYTEHCAVGMPAGRKRECGSNEKKYYCRQGEYFLRDRKGADFPVICDSSVCRMEILSHKISDRRNFLRVLSADRRIKRMPSARIYIYDESPDLIGEIVESLSGIYRNSVE